MERWTRRCAAAAMAVAGSLVIAGAAVPHAAGAAPAAPTISWTACADAPQVDCGTLTVPLDYQRPNGSTIKLALERRKADDQAHKIGSLFVNPGGPGGSGRAYGRNAERVFGKDVVARFDVIGFDPRGISLSSGLRCFATDAEFEAVLGAVPSVPLSSGEIADTLAANRKYTQACGRNAGPLLRHMSTLNVVKDLDVMRQAVGDAKLNFVGFSYGTLIGATYANVFPNKVRALVLDGPVDADRRTNDRIPNKLDRAGGFETALAAFLANCQSSATACPLYGGSLTPRQKFDKLRERLRTGPLPAGGTGVVTISSFTDAVGSALYRLDRLKPLATELNRVYDLAFGSAASKRSAQAAPLSMLTQRRVGPSFDQQPGPLAATGDAYSYNSVDANYAVNCVDAPMPRDQRKYPPLAAAFETAHRTFGRSELYGEVACATWPVVTKERYAGPWDRKTSAPVLVIGQTFDPATPYTMATHLAFELGNAQLLTIDGFGHCSQASVCSANARAKYLLTQQLPDPGSRCGQDTVPFPAAT
ncbi:alpha/beta hydrolase [Fodinicola acaciae]|uniref:alpha/beta hydrolase n=1 Tax=Fodinicola acaciae TaxID=2681555 RepID=UPI0013D39BFB|nr:alpha/beta hydrolase [Fodinicola acaciae]